MKLITWNVNGLRAVERKKELESLLRTYAPDILVLQETKCKESQISNLINKYSHYQQYYVAAQKAGYAGVCVWVKTENILGAKFLAPKIGTFDDEGRIAETVFRWNQKKYSVIGCYFPNGGKSDEAWQGKLVFYQQFLEYINQRRADGYTVIWGGDVNCAHNEIDLARPKNNDGKIGFHPLERAWIDTCVENNWYDVWRKTNPATADTYSWWHLITRSRARNVGWRIDYWFCGAAVLPNIKNIAYLNNQMGSDHCPVLLEIEAHTLSHTKADVHL
jgi:exodeoxyribonuclease-3